LGQAYDLPEDADRTARICVTGGASQSIACILQSYTDPSATLAVWVVAPCYFLACPIIEDAGFAGKMKAVQEDDEGIDLDWLAAEMSRLEEEKDVRARREAVGLWNASI
jgi:DNA-binding transcriptional MocR family regulator